MRREMVTIKSIVSGEVVAQFVVETDVVRDEPKGAPPYIAPDAAREGAQPGPAARPPKPNDTGGERMTEPQRRYLFRLLAAQNVTGKAAEKRLKDYFLVTALGDIPRQDASQYIDQLIKDRQDAAS